MVAWIVGAEMHPVLWKRQTQIPLVVAAKWPAGSHGEEAACRSLLLLRPVPVMVYNLLTGSQGLCRSRGRGLVPVVPNMRKVSP